MSDPKEILSVVHQKKWHRPFPSEIKIGTPYGVPGPVTQWKRGFHCGDDFLAQMLTDVEAADNGFVEWAGNAGDGFGLYIRLGHADGTKSYYPHLSQSHVAIGDVISKTQVIGLSGNSGNVWHDGHPITEEERTAGLGAHCHFEVRFEGEPFKPEYEMA